MTEQYVKDSSMNQDRKILLVSIFFAPEPIGVSKYTAELAHFLSNSGFSVRVISAFPFYPQWRLYPGYPVWRFHKEKIGKVEVTRCPLWVPAQVTGPKRLLHLLTYALSSSLAILMQAGWRPETVWVVVPTLVNVPATLLLSKLTNSHSWLHVQDFELDLAQNLNILPGLPWLIRWLQAIDRLLFCQFDRVSTISQEMSRRLLEEKNVHEGKAIMLPNWVDCEEIYPLDRQSCFRAKLNIADDSVVALYSGNMGRKYGLGILAETACRLKENPSIRFVFCGDGAGRQELEDACAGLANVTFLPLQPEEMLNELLNLADIHLLPQKSDAASSVMPSKLLGMMASGRPMIATVHPETEIGRIIQDCGVITPPEDSGALADALLSLSLAPDWRREMGECSRIVAKANFDKKRVLAAFVQSLNTLDRRLDESE